MLFQAPVEGETIQLKSVQLVPVPPGITTISYSSSSCLFTVSLAGGQCRSVVTGAYSRTCDLFQERWVDGSYKGHGGEQCWSEATSRWDLDSVGPVRKSEWHSPSKRDLLDREPRPETQWGAWARVEQQSWGLSENKGRYGEESESDGITDPQCDCV